MHKKYSKLCRGGLLKSKQTPIKVDEKDTIENRKSKLQCFVDDRDGVLDDFKKFLRSKYGFVNGIYGKELLEAISCYLALNQFEHYKHKSIDYFGENGPAHKHLKSDHQTLLGHLDHKFQKGEVIKFKQIQDIIRIKFGRRDRRTHKSYVEALRASLFLIQPDGVKDYDYYFFKEMPQPRDGQPTHVVDVQTRLVFPGNKLYDLLPGPGEGFTVQRLRKMTTLKDADFQAGLKQLTELKIIRNVGIGQFIVEEV